MSRRTIVLGALAGVLGVLGGLALWPGATPAQPREPNALPVNVARQPLAQLPISEVILFSSGVGYFAREGEVEGTARVDLTFPVTNINDLLKSLVTRDLGGGRISSVTYDSHDPISKTLQSFALDRTANPTFGELLNQARGERVEVQLPAGAAPTATLTGTIVGMEEQQQPTGKDQTVKVQLLNLLTSDGLRSLPLSQVQRVRFLNPIVDAELKRALDVLALSHDTQKKSVSITFAGQGKRPVLVSYVVEHPIWKTSYRLVIEKDGKLFLQGWAIVENPSDDDWNNVQMTLVSGRPISFQMDLYQPLYVPRPTVEPELFSSLRPQAYGSSMVPSGVIVNNSINRPEKPESPFGITTKLRSGERPFTIKITESGSRFIRPEDMVDVIATMEYKGELISETVLQRIEVLAVDQDQSNRSSRLVSLGVKPDQAEMLAAMERVCRFHLVPRTSGDKMYVPPGTRIATLLKLKPAGQSNEAFLDTMLQLDRSHIVQREMNIAQGVVSAATAREMGDFFQYPIAQKVNLPRQKSAMIPIVSQGIEGTKVSIYNEGVHAKYPLHGLKFRNTTGVHLMQGPITVFEAGSYAGDARIMDLPPNAKDERLLSYAIDLGVEVEPVHKREPDQLVAVKIVKGVLHASHKLRQARTYNVKNRTEHDRVVLLEHPFRPDWQLFTPEKPADRSREVYRFQVKVAAGKTASQEVVEELTQMNSISLNNLDDPSLKLFLGSAAVSPKVKEALQKAVALKAKWLDTQRAMARLGEQLRAISEDQTRLRANLEKVPATSAAYKRYLEKFDTQETEIEKLQEQSRVLKLNEEQQRKEYEGYLPGLNIE